MYLGKYTDKIKDRTEIVPFCEDCDSQDIEIIQTCRCCGSHNISSGKLFDERAEKIIYKDCTLYKYKCDGCGKQFSVKMLGGKKTASNRKISFVEGDFVPYECDDATFEYIVPGDYCGICLDKLVDKLNFDINRVVTSTYIESTMNKLFPKEDDKK